MSWYGAWELPTAGSLNYKPFTLKAALELASPPSLVASIGPCCIAGALAVCCAVVYAFLPAGEQGYTILSSLAVTLDARSALCWVLMLLCATLMQSATNTLNDYHDFKSGLDTAETILDETDASIVYNQINPRAALVFAVVLLAIAAVLGVIVSLLTSWVLLVLGLVSAAVVVLYSAGPRPISSLPLGEAVSGIVLGGVLASAAFYATTQSFSLVVLALVLVPTVSIAQIMQTNNTCDIDRDLMAGRKTMPGRIGQKRSAILNAALSWVAFLWLALVLLWAHLYAGLIIVLAGLIICLSKINRLLKGPYDLANRRVMMGTVISYNRWLSASTIVALLLGGAISAIA